MFVWSVKTVKNAKIIILNQVLLGIQWWWNMTSLMYDNIRNSFCSCKCFFLSNVFFCLLFLITNVIFCHFWKKCYLHIKIISNLASNCINTNKFTPHKNNLLLCIFPLHGMQVSLPSSTSTPPIPTSKSSENV